MKTIQSRQKRPGFTLVEVQLVVLAIGIVTAIAFPFYINSSNTSREETANKNARALAAVVQRKATATNGYDSNVSDYASMMGGSIPVNPCTGTTTGYAITTTATTATVSASAGSNCGSWDSSNLFALLVGDSDSLTYNSSPPDVCPTSGGDFLFQTLSSQVVCSACGGSDEIPSWC